MFSSGDLLFLVPEQPFSYPVAGGFARRILVVTQSEDDPAFLSKIMISVQIHPQKDALLAGVPSGSLFSLLPVLKEKQPEYVLVFGFRPEEAGLNIDAPFYHPVAFQGATWLFCDPLALLEPDKQKKALLWRALQHLFLT